MDQELMRLCSAARDGTITTEEFERLEQRLREDGEARNDYLRLAQLQALLETCPPEVDFDRSRRAENKGSIWNKAALGWCAAAAAIAIMSTILVKSTLRVSGTTEIAANEPIPIATLIFAEGCEWVEGKASPPAEGERLHPGTVGIRSGTAVIRFDGGAEMLLKGESMVVLHTAGSGEVVSGEVVVRADDGAEGFILHTPGGEVVDLGTEFAVKVEPSGASEVHVLEGEVSCGGRDNPTVIRAGHALRFERAGAGHEVALDAARFADVIRRAEPRPRADLMKVYEGFNYPEGERKIQACAGGKGWAGPWRLRKEEERPPQSKETSPQQLSIGHGEMNVAWPVAGGRKGMLRFPPRMTILVRELGEALSMDRDAVTYFSLMVRETSEPPPGSRFEMMRLTFRSSEDYFGPSLSFGYGADSHPRVQLGDGVGFTSLALAPRGESSLWIGKIVSRSDGEDEVYFRIYSEDEKLGYAEPAAWHVATRGVTQSARFDRLLLTSNGSVARIVDELRIGPTWRSVAPLPPID